MPDYTVRSQLKRNAWDWNPVKMCWITRLSKQAEQLAISLGATDGTQPNTNPSTAAGEMDLNKIRLSMITVFKDPKFGAYSLEQIEEYLNSIKRDIPFVVETGHTEEDCFVVMLGDVQAVKFITLGFAKKPEMTDETRRIFSIDSDFAQSVIRGIAFSRPYVLYNSTVCFIASVSNTPYLRSVIEHTKALNQDRCVDVWVYRLKRPCPHHDVQSVTAYVATDKLSVEQPINVAYCPVCKKYYINAEQYRVFGKRNGLPYFRLKVEGGPDYQLWKEESLLHCMGYNVNALDNLASSERRYILERIIDTGTLSKIEVISFLEFLIHQNENNYRMSNASSKWRSDADYIRRYRLNEQRSVRARILFRS